MNVLTECGRLKIPREIIDRRLWWPGQFCEFLRSIKLIER